MRISELHLEFESSGYSLDHVSDMGGNGGDFCLFFSLGEPHFNLKKDINRAYWV